MTRGRPRVAFVVPRYGVDVVGGAETLVRGFAEHLAAEGHAVEVFTTCARESGGNARHVSLARLPSPWASWPPCVHRAPRRLIPCLLTARRRA